jgi:hypothetical protein
LAWISIAVAALCAVWIAVDEARHPQAMVVMNVVWPITALYFSVIAVWAYYRWGRLKTKESMQQKMKHGHKDDAPEGRRPSPTFSQVAVGASHCGAGCMVADVGCEFAIAALGITLLGSVLWSEYTIDFGVAWVVGIGFQYFAIKPMGDLSTGQALWAAIKADTLSILAFQVGMYAWMALTYFVFFPEPHLTPFDARFWLMMQAAMICGFLTTCPVNYGLLRSGLKEAM